MLFSFNQIISSSLMLLLVACKLGLLVTAHKCHKKTKSDFDSDRRKTTPAPYQIVPMNGKCNQIKCANQSNVWCNCGGIKTPVPESGTCNSSQCYLTGTDCQCHWKYDFCGCTQLPLVCFPSECSKKSQISCSCESASNLPFPTNANCSVLMPIYGTCYESGQRCSCSETRASTYVLSESTNVPQTSTYAPSPNAYGNYCNCLPYIAHLPQPCIPSQCEKKSNSMCRCGFETTPLYFSDDSNPTVVETQPPRNGTCKSLEKLFGQCYKNGGQTCKCSSDRKTCDCMPAEISTHSSLCDPAQCEAQSHYMCICGDKFLDVPPTGTCESLNEIYGNNCFETPMGYYGPYRCACSNDGTQCICTSNLDPTPIPELYRCNPEKCAFESYRHCICDGQQLTPPENKTCKSLEEVYTRCDEYGRDCECPTNGTSTYCNCTDISESNICYSTKCAKQSSNNCRCGKYRNLPVPKNGICAQLEPLYGPCYQTGTKCACNSNKTYCDCVPIQNTCNPLQCAAESSIRCSCNDGVYIIPPKNVTCQMLADVYGECYETGIKCECSGNDTATECNCTNIGPPCNPDTCAKQSNGGCQCGGNYLVLPPSGSCKELEAIYGACYQTGKMCECSSQQPSYCSCNYVTTLAYEATTLPGSKTTTVT